MSSLSKALAGLGRPSLWVHRLGHDGSRHHGVSRHTDRLHYDPCRSPYGHYARQRPVVDLADQLVLKEVLPQGHLVSGHEVVAVVEPAIAYPREGVAGVSGACASCKEACEEHEREEGQRERLDVVTKLVVLPDLLEGVGDLFLRAAEEVECVPETNCIESVGETSVDGEAIWADSRDLVDLICLVLRIVAK